MTDAGFCDGQFLLEQGDVGFSRQVERLILQFGFTDAINVDGPGDKGADLVAKYRRGYWVLQIKWKKRRNVGKDAVEEVFRAMQQYGIHRGVVVTNQGFTRDAEQRAAEYRSVGVNLDLWTGNDLRRVYHRAPELREPFRLHRYQQRAVDAARDALDEDNRALIYLATGLGKTVVAGRLLARFLRDKPQAQVLVVAHTQPLVEQLERSMWRDIPKNIKTRLLNGVAKPDDLDGVTFAVLPTAASYVENGYRPDLVIVDEAHHVGQDGHYARMLALLPDTPRVGVTATPWRGDTYDIEQIFGPPCVRVSISEGMRLGYLADVDYSLYADNIDWDFVQHSSEKGYSIKDLNRRLFIPERDEAIRDNLLTTWQETVNPRAIVFCQTIQHAERMAALLRAVPGWGNAQAIHADLAKRDVLSRLLGFRTGDIPILTTVDLLNEGVDVPDVNILCFARVTHSRRIFVQQLGRGLRLREGKTKVTVLDFVNDVRRLAEVHSLAQQVNETDIEEVNVGRNQFLFRDERVTGLIDQWIADVGDLGGADDSVRLEFPPTEG